MKKGELLVIVQEWWLHSRTQTMGAKFLRAGEKSVNRVTGAAVNVTGAAANVISYVNPLLGTWSSPFSSPAPHLKPASDARSASDASSAKAVDIVSLDGSEGNAPLTQRLAKTLPSARTARSTDSIPDPHDLFRGEEEVDEQGSGSLGRSSDEWHSGHDLARMIEHDQDLVSALRRPGSMKAPVHEYHAHEYQTP